MQYAPASLHHTHSREYNKQKVAVFLLCLLREDRIKEHYLSAVTFIDTTKLGVSEPEIL